MRADGWFMVLSSFLSTFFRASPRVVLPARATAASQTENNKKQTKNHTNMNTNTQCLLLQQERHTDKSCSSRAAQATPVVYISSHLTVKHLDFLHLSKTAQQRQQIRLHMMLGKTWCREKKAQEHRSTRRIQKRDNRRRAGREGAVTIKLCIQSRTITLASL